MEGISLTPQQEKLQALQQLLPEAFAEGKIDWEKLKATLGEDINFSNERYVLNWAGKSDAFKVLQSPTTKTLVPAKDESINFDTTENIFIEGENLEVLKVLQKSYFGKVKMIYIDPPYNTGNDSFIYPDKFAETLKEYQERVGDIDEEGYLTKDGMFKKNSKENGQYHSNWLNMMMPRLYLAKNLLRQDGVIFVSIDDNEVHNLRLLMNEVFGEENFVGQWNWFKSATPPNLSKKIKKNIEFILGFQKGENNDYFTGIRKPSSSDDGITKPQNTLKKLIFPIGKINTTLEDGTYKIGIYGTEKYPNELINELIIKDGRNLTEATFQNRFTWTQPKLNEELENNTTINLSKNLVLSIKKAEYKPEVPPNLIDKNVCVDTTENAGRYLSELLGKEKIFDYPKPVSLIKYLINFCVNSNDVILDFFAGSGTTAHAVMELNKEDGGKRKYICVQMPELCDDKSEAYREGYKTIVDISKERIRRASKKIADDFELEKEKKENEISFEKVKEVKIDLGFKVLKLADSNFKQWRQIEGKDAKALTEQMQLFIDPVSENATIENMVYEFLLKSGKDLNSKIEKKNDYYIINGGELIMLLETASQEIIELVIAEKPTKVIALDKLFKDNDQLKTNTVLQMKDAAIEFKTV